MKIIELINSYIKEYLSDVIILKGVEFYEEEYAEYRIKLLYNDIELISYSTKNCELEWKLKENYLNYEKKMKDRFNKLKIDILT